MTGTKLFNHGAIHLQGAETKYPCNYIKIVEQMATGTPRRERSLLSGQSWKICDPSAGLERPGVFGLMNMAEGILRGCMVTRGKKAREGKDKSIFSKEKIYEV